MIVVDTHVLLWLVDDSSRLGRRARRTFDRVWPSGEVMVSAITFWEIALLVGRDRLALPVAPDAFRASVLESGFAELPVSGEIGIRAVDLGGMSSDPGDRMIVATALVHGAELMTADERILAWRGTLVRHDARK